MFNLFKKENKTYLPIKEYEESWAILQEPLDKNIIRINAGYKEAIGHPDYVSKMGVAIPVKEHDEKTMALKSNVEDTLNEILSKDDTGVLVAIITSQKEPKFIEFLSYVKKSANFALIHQTLKDKFPEEDVQMYADLDPKWNTYKAYLGKY